MNNEADVTLIGTDAPVPGDSSKLVSLLALAAGAAAIPQTGVAEIVYTDLSASPVQVGWLGGTSSYTFTDLPGSVQFGFRRFQTTNTTTYFGVVTYLSRWVTAGQQGGTAAASVRATQTYSFFAQVLPAGATWGAGNGGPQASVSMGFATSYYNYPFTGYTDQYLAWVFEDTTQGGASLYGWIQVSLAIARPPASGPRVTITGYAYDDRPGEKPMMGQVPEPSSSGLLVLGALALGSRGLRQWRRARSATKHA